MKILTNIRLILSKSVISTIAICCFILIGCKDENKDKGFFEIKDNASLMEVTADGSSQTYSFQSSGKWKIEPLRKESWVKIEPLEGSGNGTFTITVAKNTDVENRDLQIFFKVDDRLQDAVLKISQEGAIIDDSQKDSYIRFESNLLTTGIPEAGLTQNTVIRATGKWRIEVEDEQEWVAFSKTEGEGDTPISVTVARNTDIERTANIRLFLNNIEQLTPISIAQKGVKLQVVGDTVLLENFSWLTYGSDIINTTNGETRIGLWTAAELARGWTSTINNTEGGGNYSSIYGRLGFIKLGRTNYGADIISPKLEKVQRTKNLVVTFKALRHGSTDHHLLTIGVNGPGTVSTSSFSVTNFASPNTTLAGTAAAWQAPEATYSFVINGATSNTQIWFLAGAFDQRAVSGWPSTTNRIYIDDILVKVTN